MALHQNGRRRVFSHANNNVRTTMNKIGKTSAMVLGLALSAAMPSAAQAQTSKTGVYAGVAAGQSDSQKYQCEQSSTCNKTGRAYRFFTGWQFTRVLGVEFGYT